MFRRNVGGLDRVLRVTLGPILVIAGLLLLAGRATVGMAVIVVGLLALITGIVSFCVLYVPFGISTANPKELRGGYQCDCMVATEETRDQFRAGKPPVGNEVHEDEVTMSAGRSR